MGGPRATRLTGYLFHELMFWHDAGHFGSVKRRIQPARHVEHSETKRRMHNLIAVSGLMEQLKLLAPRQATIDELSRGLLNAHAAHGDQRSVDWR
ncbi:histone deacetylase [Monoraphidium neglectum]|uniref:Histone deacetylase n=1 Tax=Monoraphidium neglectum TaxID=145388 RepID=A0A0D2MG29_9CHLO|nr:histone deacetylase [Monoraphidium neglectum]KIY94045.1 histone deacetylase [Monoraphidium neglectum]|eukprot:XP_013893065.1 histone deacetylase [Monoraphidium neglectum]